MHVEVYADESGTHDRTGKLEGAREATVAGLAALPDDWARFCVGWKWTLQKYRAPYFHFREWRDAEVVARKNRQPTSDFEKNPYRGWSQDKLKSFALELAGIAGSGNKLLVGDFVDTEHFHESKLTGGASIGANPYEKCIKGLFAQCLAVINTQRASWKNLPVSFIFDTPANKEWKLAVEDAFHSHQKDHPRWTLAFADKTGVLPLQAADMVAYRTRVITGKWIDDDLSGQWTDFDMALFKPVFDFCEAHRDEVLRAFLLGKLRYNPV